MPTELTSQTLLAAPTDTRRVLRMTLAIQDQSAVELEGHVTSFIQYARAMNLDLSRQWLLQSAGRIVCACTCIESPGRTAMLFLPESRKHSATASQIVDMLRGVLAEEATRGIRLAQCLLGPTDAGLRAALCAVGFSEIAELLYMECSSACLVRGADAINHSETAKAAWITYSAQVHERMAALILETYRESLDCPGLSGLRNIEDIITGHKSAGIFRPDRWLIYMQDGCPVACILLGESPLRSALEVVYMGVHPSSRGQGLGNLLLAKALEIAHAQGIERVTLAVDARNAPALAIYRRFGFETCYRRTAMICPIGVTTHAT